MAEKLRAGSLNPRDTKMQLAREMVELLYNGEAAKKAQESFVSVFQDKKNPEDMETLELETGTIKLADLIAKAGGESKSQAKRLAKQGGVKLNDKKETNPFDEIRVKDGDILRIGKRRFYNLKVKS